MKLLIVESPTKTKTIAKYLPKGEKYVIKASVGHIRDLPKSNKAAIDIEAGFVPHYEISPDKTKIVADLIASAKKADEILLAPDPDREGEAIAWHISELLTDAKVPASKIKRVSFNEITKTAVQNALANPHQIDQNLRHAQEARRVLDRLFGYDLSGLIWKKVRYGLSAGRVQSPALRILAQRERLIQAFIPDVYWTICADLVAQNGGDAIPFACDDRDKKLLALMEGKSPEEQKAEIARIAQIVDNIVKTGKTGDWQVASVKETQQKRSPYAPFTTSTLQQTASSRLGFAPARTMGLAQKLYAAGHITYMRTDSPTLSAEALAQISSVIKRDFGADMHQPRVFKSRSKNAQEAHEAVRPTECAKEIAGTNTDEQRLYKLIRTRAIASQMIDAQISKTKIIANVQTAQTDSDFIDFAVNGMRVISPGWLALDTAARGEDVQLPQLTAGDKLTCQAIQSEQKETSPPNRYTEAGLVKELEKRGIGRPSTYASIIKTICERGYVDKEGRTLIPTLTGMVVSSFLEEHFAQYISDDFTAQMENELDEIAIGKDTYLRTVTDFYTPFAKAVADKQDIDKLTNLGDADPKWKCPQCDGKMVIKLSKNDSFLSCAKFPDCTGARKSDGSEMAPPKETGENCPDCGIDSDKEIANRTSKSAKKLPPGKLVIREGKYGKFVSCSNYPKCKYIKEDEEEAAKKKTGVACPDCKDGEMVERRGRFGIFYSCSNYPKCKNAIKTKPTGRHCDYLRTDKDGDKCGALMMEGTKTIPERCSAKTCPNHRPDKLAKEKAKK